MPLVRVDMHAALAPRREAISAAIHKGLVDGLAMPEDDLFQVFRLHEPGELVYSRTFPNADRNGILFVQILLARIYGPEDKQRMYGCVVDELVGAGVKRDEVLIAVTENEGSDWCAPDKEA
ncbi:tautomerase family protein [Curtobacterium sp. MCBD17_035]|uniref:tautomerase family protein n=1 Tax=Curtobacterium sp. MCBD17_035 TaxID=2175673 RepID=UPI000DA9517A|nr:tautomerase family protein [Curtobacterium sp. MCBD17_035]WIB68316.1 tautomerase family protein [Curtobacterium sp. MCBD17_035]